MNTNEIILVGGGGHCKSCIDVIESEGKFKIKGIIDLPHLLGSETLGYKVIGNDDDIPSFIAQGYSFLITMGHLGNANRRNQLFENIHSLDGNLATVISSTAKVSSHASIGKGSIIMHNTMINAGTQIGANCIINSGSIVEHDVVVEKHSHISTGAILNGDVEIKEESFVGSGALIKNGLSIAKNTIIGMGAIVVKNIENSGTYIGNPARKI